MSEIRFVSTVKLYCSRNILFCHCQRDTNPYIFEEIKLYNKDIEHTTKTQQQQQIKNIGERIHTNEMYEL